MDTEASTHIAHAPADHLHPQRSSIAQHAERLAALRKDLPRLQRLGSGLHHGLICAAAAVVAYLPAQALGLKQSFWAAITAIAVVQTEFRATQSTARDQFVGAAVGGVIGLGSLLVLGDGLSAYATAVVLAMVICWAINRASASRLAGITATIIVLVPRVESPERMFVARILEVAWGVCVAVLLVWLAARLPQRVARRAGCGR
ncbi:MAG: FUSC family protein [Steroidobacteraceae bacterium]